MPNASNGAAKDAARLAARLARNAVDSLPQGALAGRLEQAAIEGRPLRVKLGIDPTAPDIHLGHAVVLRKLREFQDAGHRVVLIIGDYTARVGDPSGRSTLRPILSGEEIEANAATFQQQALRILDADGELLEVRRNGEWLDMPMVDLLALTRTTTVAQLLERDDFAKRWSANEPISLLELLYPPLQGYDSVAIDADVELGGTDQKFNLLLGRDIQRAYGKPEQSILTMPLLVGTDGQKKMSKSLGNQIGITDAPQEMYGKAMSIPDEAVAEYRRLLLDDPSDVPARNAGTSAGAAQELRAGGRESAGADGARAQAGAGLPEASSGAAAREAKRALARDLVGWLHSPEQAAAAEQHFDRVFVSHEAPEEIEEAAFAAAEGSLYLPGLIAAEFGVSGSEARRLIDQGGVTLGGAAVGRGQYDVASADADGQVLKVGKRRFRHLRAT
ncbi:MAG TPA: tyrosine--tRNA ligase [Solirubrobacteraceae bacterium]|jgi:tyrosyl-tRNA synthetase|nr:tyrosine--tRNA ligase [Solirubrobacteraceae bacterium]